MRLGQVVVLDHSLAEPDAEETAGREADHGLHRLEAGAERVVPRVQEAEEAYAAVRRERDRHEPEGSDVAGAERERPARCPRNKQDDSDDDDDHDRRPEIRLGEHETAEHKEQHAERSPQFLQRARCRTAGEIGRRPDRERELRELRRLEGRRAERQPAARAVDACSDRQDGEAEEKRADEYRRRECAQPPVVEACTDHHQRNTDQRVHTLLLEV